MAIFKRKNKNATRKEAGSEAEPLMATGHLAPPAQGDVCGACGKELRDPTGPQVFTSTSLGASSIDDVFAATEDAADQMLAGRRVCASCGAVFCLECGNAEGRRQGLGSTNCPSCGRKVG